MEPFGCIVFEVALIGNGMGESKSNFGVGERVVYRGKDSHSVMGKSNGGNNNLRTLVPYIFKL